MASREEMLIEAAERMKILGLNEEDYIKPLIKGGEVRITEQQFWDFDPRTKGGYEIIEEFPNFTSIFGRRYQIFTVTPNEKTEAVIKQLEQTQNCLVYHVNRIELDKPDKAGNEAYYTYMTVSSDEDNWGFERPYGDSFLYGWITPQNEPQGSSENLLYWNFLYAKCCYGCVAVSLG